ncbi:MAG: hypothetical protein KF784_02880 [Fimbriimonadaceae bacterium]|nr:hypothetical protein [Fimbriimonadaceae bacterium]
MSKRTLFLTVFALVGATAFAADNDKLPEVGANLENVAGTPQTVKGTRTALRLANSLWGPTGLIFIPTAYTTDSKAFGWGVGMTKDFSAGSINYGILRDIEVGGAYVDRVGMSNKSIANAKVHIIPSNFDWFEIGVGVMDAVDAINQTFYFVGSADVYVPDFAAQRGAVGLRVHAGAGTGYFSEKPFGGAELLFDRGFSGIGEWDTKNMNLALRYAHKDEFFVEIGSYASKAMFKMSYTMRF